ncbi:MAG: hypothetical protein OH319_00995 [Candidatus Parvarchaeota archaeon]|nr:hypothetical protein [Candidatus Jingweiarchaeum tengchongense]MCW1297849.1 hypothetical protein [Candidatus Jingweiarchaeum tengchongense]MCW1299860.1 hypothetical protein [Candidatus Jingweiarchaeum tengchongense]MCW1304170.1 hypothetical protein [Candidatus Jingweiarchaeum tengchongense]MCW1305198.1 hypothetical protein [Candidatus Jingweiarchaeum tengchongense]
MKIQKYALPFLLAFLIFISGLYFDSLLNRVKTSKIEQSVEDIKNSLVNVELEFLFMDVMKEQLSCNYFRAELSKMLKEIDDLMSKLERYEENKGIDTTGFIEAKKSYTLSLVKMWLIFEKVKKICNENYTTVLYFYTKDCGNCPLQGFYLTYYKKIEPDKIMVFALEKDLNLQIIDSMIYNYNITIYPTLVINGKNKYEGFKERDELAEIFCNETNKTLVFC